VSFVGRRKSYGTGPVVDRLLVRRFVRPPDRAVPAFGDWLTIGPSAAPEPG